MKAYGGMRRLADRGPGWVAGWVKGREGVMCPVCITTMLIAGSVTLTGGLATGLMARFGVKRAVDPQAARASAAQPER